MTRKEQNALLDQSGTPARWLRFYMRVVLWLQMGWWMLAALEAFGRLSDIVGTWRKDPMLLLFPANQIGALLGILAYIHFRRGLSWKAYRWNFAYLCWCPVALGWGLFDLTFTRFTPDRWTALVLFNSAVLLVALLWTALNLVYLRKRRHLFRAYTKEEIAEALEKQEAALDVIREEARMALHANEKKHVSD
jgi:hypothetical protein